MGILWFQTSNSDSYSAIAIAVMYAKSCYTGPCYSGTLLYQESGLILGFRPANETLQGKAVSHWLGANLGSALNNDELHAYSWLNEIPGILTSDIPQQPIQLSLNLWVTNTW